MEDIANNLWKKDEKTATGLFIDNYETKSQSNVREKQVSADEKIVKTRKLPETIQNNEQVGITKGL